MSDPECKDYPADLRLSVGQETLAHALYENRSTAFGLPKWPWDKITELEKATYRTEALVWLLAHSPARKPRVDYVTRDYRAKVIGEVKP
jgi:hypothetical protein